LELDVGLKSQPTEAHVVGVTGGISRLIAGTHLDGNVRGMPNELPHGINCSSDRHDSKISDAVYPVVSRIP
jgi:hypothetical protein